MLINFLLILKHTLVLLINTLHNKHTFISTLIPDVSEKSDVFT